MKDKPKNMVASVQGRLQKLAKEQGEEFQLVLTRYCLERLLYRLSQSRHRDTFVLKGAMLFQLWTRQIHRPTKDLDLLGRGDNQPEQLANVFREVCQQAVEEDGLTFQIDALQAERIREDQEYQGSRITVPCLLGRMRVKLQIDIGFGDAITPAATEVNYPTMLDFPAPALLAYPKETVVAEKFQAMVMLGMSNSRMKDFYDLWILARDFTFEGAALSQAIQATFQRRQTTLPENLPLALRAEFYENADKQKQWQGFVRKSKLDTAGHDLAAIVDVLQDFLLPPTAALVKGQPFDMIWPTAGPWRPR